MSSSSSPLRRTALIVGSSLPADELEAMSLPFVTFNRHGERFGLKPHEIDHVANAKRLAAAGVTAVVSVCSVGSLTPSIGLHAVVVPDDYFCPHTTQLSGGHIVPTLDEPLRQRLVDAACAALHDAEGGDAAAARRRLRATGTYAQSTGPRFETRAEIRFFATYAHVIGMTMASEAEAMQNEGIAYAALCVVDNMANGVVAAETLSFDAFKAGVRSNKQLVMSILRKLAEQENAEQTAASKRE